MLIELLRLSRALSGRPLQFSTAAPKHITKIQGKLSRWRDEREVYAEDRINVDRKMADALAAPVSQKIR